MVDCALAPIPNFEVKENIHGGMRLYENTVPLDDTVAINSPSMESGLLSTDMNTQVLHGCESPRQSGDQREDYFEKGVVLDSDDEGGNQSEAVNSAKSSRIDVQVRSREAVGLLGRQQAPAGYFRKLNKVSKNVLDGPDSDESQRSDKETTSGSIVFYNDKGSQECRLALDSVVLKSSEQKPVLINPVNTEYLNIKRENLMEDFAERKSSSHESNYMDMEKDSNYDCNRDELNYFGSPQVAESQDKALQFVDDYLSICDIDSCKDGPTTKTDTIKSPPSLRSMGTQCLAKRLTLGSTVSKLKTFDWAENPVEEGECASLRLYKDPIFEFRDERCGSLSVNKEFPNLRLQKEISILQPEGKLLGNTLSPNNLDTVCLSSNDTEKIGSNSGVCIVPQAMELDDQLDAGILRQNEDNVEQYRLTPDESYVGLDTQMAAEAMEELVNSGPPRVDACFTHQGSDNILLGTTNTVNNKGKSNIACQNVAFVDWSRKEKRSKSVKTSTAKDKSLSRPAAKKFKNQRRTAAKPVVGRNLMTKKLMAEEFFNSRSSENTMNGNFESHSRTTVQLEEYGIAKRDSLKELQKLDRVCSSLSETADGVQHDPPPKVKKMRSSFREGAQRKGINLTSLKPNSRPSFEVKTDAKNKENCYDVVPKGKRKCQFAAVDDNLEKYPNEQAVDRVAKLLVYNRPRKVSLERELIGSSLKLVHSSSSENNSAVPDGQVQTPLDSNANKPLKECGTPDGISVTLQSLEGSDKRKQSPTPVSKSPLMKELTRLGHNGSFPDFLPKDSRRRRGMDKVCILFSQNLDTRTLKQQKKIAARLGFPAASCPSEATHFVADRFVRTKNMLETIGLGKPVVRRQWLESCQQAGYVVDEKTYILRDEKKEKEVGFNMHATLTRSSQLPLLKGRRVLITPNVKPSLDVITSLVRAVQGEIVENIPNAKMKGELIHNGLLILSSEEDHSICLPFIQKGASIYDSELLLNGIVTRKLEYERYRLFEDP